MKKLLERYRNPKFLLRGCAHFMLTGLITAFFIRYSLWGFCALIFPFLLETYQALRNPKEFEWFDCIMDTVEHLLGGILIGLLFYLT